MTDSVTALLLHIRDHNGKLDKTDLAKDVAKIFGLSKDGSIYYCSDYAVRFSSSFSRNFGNTVLSLSRLQKFDDRPFIVCLVTPSINIALIANTTFLKKISHSS